MSDTQNKWIPVSERLPEKTVEKLVLLTNGEQCVAFIGGVSGGWIAPGIGIITQPTHWMDLPEPPAPPKPVDPFEAWWAHAVRRTMDKEIAFAAWTAAKAHYAKLLPDFETFARKYGHANGEWLQFDGDRIVTRECALFIWNAAQGKPEA